MTCSRVGGGGFLVLLSSPLLILQFPLFAIRRMSFDEIQKKEWGWRVAWNDSFRGER
jgi:hypothetical protein